MISTILLTLWSLTGLLLVIAFFQYVYDVSPEKIGENNRAFLTAVLFFIFTLVTNVCVLFFGW